MIDISGDDLRVFESGGTNRGARFPIDDCSASVGSNFVIDNLTQTLTNKTLTSPKVGTAILDTNGNELISVTATGSAVNEISITNATTGNRPVIGISGGDTNIGITIQGKGTGRVHLNEATFSNAYRETVYAITDGAAFEIDPSNGTIQTITLGASRTPKATNFADGESVTLMVNDGSSYALTWTDTTFGTSGVSWIGGTAPTLLTTGYTVIVLWKVSSQVYGMWKGA
jgi:hypothetical protein